MTCLKHSSIVLRRSYLGNIKKNKNKNKRSCSKIKQTGGYLILSCYVDDAYFHAGHREWLWPYKYQNILLHSLQNPYIMRLYITINSRTKRRRKTKIEKETKNKKTMTTCRSEHGTSHSHLSPLTSPSLSPLTSHLSPLTSHLTSPHLTSPHLTSPHLTSTPLHPTPPKKKKKNQRDTCC